MKKLLFLLIPLFFLLGVTGCKSTKSKSTTSVEETTHVKTEVAAETLAVKDSLTIAEKTTKTTKHFNEELDAVFHLDTSGRESTIESSGIKVTASTRKRPDGSGYELLLKAIAKPNSVTEERKESNLNNTIVAENSMLRKNEESNLESKSKNKDVQKKRPPSVCRGGCGYCLCSLS